MLHTEVQTLKMKFKYKYNCLLQLGSTEGLILGQQLVFKTLRGTSWSSDSGVERRELVSKVFMNTRMLKKGCFLGCDLKE